MLVMNGLVVLALPLIEMHTLGRQDEMDVLTVARSRFFMTGPIRLVLTCWYHVLLGVQLYQLRSMPHLLQRRSRYRPCMDFQGDCFVSSFRTVTITM